MKTQLKKLGSYLGLAVLSASISIGLAGCPQTTTNNNGNNGQTETKVVEIDANFPLTGELGTFGSNLRDSTIMALEDIKQSDPQSPELKFDWQDNQGSPQNAVTVFQKQLIDAPDVYVSGFTPQTLAIKPQIDEKGIPHFAWMFSVSINNNTNNNFRTWVNYKIEAPKYLEYAKARQAKRVAILYVNLPYTTEQFQKLVIPGLKEMGIEDIYSEAYDVGTEDYKNIAVKVQQFKPDLIMLNGFGFTLAPIVKALQPLGLIENGNTIGTYDMIDTVSLLGKDELEGIRVIAPLFVTRPEKVTDWSNRFKEKFGRDPLYHNAYAYDMVTVINDAAKRLDLPATSEQWIEAIKATNIEGITGSLSFDADGDLITPIEIGVFRDGKIIPDNTEEVEQ